MVTFVVCGPESLGDAVRYGFISAASGISACRPDDHTVARDRSLTAAVGMGRGVVIFNIVIIDRAVSPGSKGSAARDTGRSNLKCVALLDDLGCLAKLITPGSADVHSRVNCRRG